MQGDDYVNLSARANGMAQELKQAFAALGCPMYSDTIANQIFPILPDELCEKLAKDFRFSVWEKVDDTHTAVRFCTNVTTARADVDALLAALKA